MTSHEFARHLLAGPELSIILPKVKEYDFDDEEQGESPTVHEHDGLDHNGNPVRVLIISQQLTPLTKKPDSTRKR